jgi:hypothetical protein
MVSPKALPKDVLIVLEAAYPVPRVNEKVVRSPLDGAGCGRTFRVRNRRSSWGKELVQVS